MALINELLRIAGDYANIANDGLMSDVVGYIDTGSYVFNAIISGSIYGGLPDNRVSALAGEPAVGKTYFALSIAKFFLNSYDDAIVVYFDTEAAIETTQLIGMKIDRKRFLHVPVESMEDFRNKIFAMIKSQEEKTGKEKKKIFFVLDSLGMLCSDKQLKDADEAKNSTDLSKPRLLKGIFQIITLKLAKAHIPMIVCSHIYKSIGTYIPMDVMSGGQATQYAASTIVFLRKSKEKDAEGNVIGTNIKCKTVKSRLTKPDKEVSVLLDFNKGIDRYSGLLEFAEAAGIAVKAEKQWKIAGHEPAWESTIVANPEKYWTKDVLDKIDIWAKNEFRYQSSVVDVKVDEEEPEETEKKTEKKKGKK